MFQLFLIHVIVCRVLDIEMFLASFLIAVCLVLSLFRLYRISLVIGSFNTIGFFLSHCNQLGLAFFFKTIIYTSFSLKSFFGVLRLLLCACFFSVVIFSPFF